MRRRRRYPIAHGPGPPHRPHMPGPAGADSPVFPPSVAATANTLIARAVSFDPHDGHATFSDDVIERTSFSNLVSHDLHAYS